jgi:predicted ATP-grasp superfamily ATP-dependent carboligase
MEALTVKAVDDQGAPFGRSGPVFTPDDIGRHANTKTEEIADELVHELVLSGRNGVP